MSTEVFQSPEVKNSFPPSAFDGFVLVYTALLVLNAQARSWSGCNIFTIIVYVSRISLLNFPSEQRNHFLLFLEHFFFFVCSEEKLPLTTSISLEISILFLINTLCVMLLKLTSEFNLNFSLCSRNPKEENYELYCLKFPTSTPWRRRGLLSSTPTRCSWLASKAKPWVTWWDRGMQPRKHDKKPVEVLIIQFSKSLTHRDNVMKLKKRQIKNRCWAVLLFSVA